LTMHLHFTHIGKCDMMADTKPRTIASHFPHLQIVTGHEEPNSKQFEYAMLDEVRSY
jgi:hypothetical protein